MLDFKVNVVVISAVQSPDVHNNLVWSLYVHSEKRKLDVISQYMYYKMLVFWCTPKMIDSNSCFKYSDIYKNTNMFLNV